MIRYATFRDRTQERVSNLVERGISRAPVIGYSFGRAAQLAGAGMAGFGVGSDPYGLGFDPKWTVTGVLALCMGGAVEYVSNLARRETSAETAPETNQ